MRKFGLIAAILGLGILGLDLLLRVLAHVSPWLWLPGTALLCGGGGLYLYCPVCPGQAVVYDAGYEWY